MARTTVRKQADRTAVRESEKQRAKRNRDKFRQLITDLNECVSKDSLSTNKCLLTAISILSLEKVHRSSSLSPDREKYSSSSSDVSSPDVSSPDSSIVSAELPPYTSHQGLEFSHLLTARDCFGVGFTDSGVILYTSPNFQHSVGYKDSVLGEHLDKIVLRADDILNKVFKDRNVHFMCMVYIVKMCGKDIAPYRFQGKVLPCVGGGKMYLGYAEKKSNIIDDPLQLFNISETVINTDLTFASKRHLYIDTLLGYSSYSSCTTEHVVSEDLSNTTTLNRISMKSITKNFFEHGFAQHVCRLLCADQTLLYVLAKVFLHVNQDGKTVMISYSFPFAFSTQSQQSIDEGMRFITSNEQWLSLMPPMCSMSQRSIMHQQQQEQVINAPDGPKDATHVIEDVKPVFMPRSFSSDSPEKDLSTAFEESKNIVRSPTLKNVLDLL